MITWDFDEKKNYIKVGKYKVLNVENPKEAADLLDKINLLILRTFLSIAYYEEITPEINLLLETPYILQEMQFIKDQGSIKFEGLNKPKGVKKSGSISIGLDGKLRARYRKIFLTLRNKNGTIKNINQLKTLISHELTHTALNHVTWRYNNHGKDFNKFNKLILRHFTLILKNVDI